MKLVGYIYNNSAIKAEPKRIKGITLDEDGNYSMHNVTYPHGHYTIPALNQPVKCGKFTSDMAVVIDEDDPNNAIQLNDIYGNVYMKGFILNTYTCNSYNMIVAIFNGDKIVKLNADMQGIPFIKPDVKSNKVLYFTMQRPKAQSEESRKRSKEFILKKIEEAEKQLEELKLARAMLNGKFEEENERVEAMNENLKTLIEITGGNPNDCRQLLTSANFDLTFALRLLWSTRPNLNKTIEANIKKWFEDNGKELVD